MTLGGADIGTWNEAIPTSGEAVGLGDDRIRSTKTTVRTALDSEHVWGLTGGIVGQHREGSARAFYGTTSQLSASDTSTVANGRMMVTSDSTRLYSVNSLGASLLGGGPGSLSIDTTAGVVFNPQNVRWAMEFGVVSKGTDTFVVTFPNSGFSGAPFLQVSSYTQPIDVSGVDPARIWKLNGVSASGFSGSLVDTSNGIGVTDAGIMWMSVGTRAL